MENQRRGRGGICAKQPNERDFTELGVTFLQKLNLDESYENLGKFRQILGKSWSNLGQTLNRFRNQTLIQPAR